MTLDELMESKKITKYEYDIFCLYSVHTTGAQLLKKEIEDSFMEVPDNLNSETLAYCEGRRAYIRNIKLIIHNIREMLDGRKQPNN